MRVIMQTALSCLLHQHEFRMLGVSKGTLELFLPLQVVPAFSNSCDATTRLNTAKPPYILFLILSLFTEPKSEDFQVFWFCASG